MSEQYTPDPFGYFKPEPFGCTECAESDDDAIPLYDKVAIKLIEKQRDELLAALEAGRRLIELISPFEGDVTRQMDKAIASVKANA